MAGTHRVDGYGSSRLERASFTSDGVRRISRTKHATSTSSEGVQRVRSRAEHALLMDHDEPSRWDRADLGQTHVQIACKACHKSRFDGRTAKGEVASTASERTADPLHRATCTKRPAGRGRGWCESVSQERRLRRLGDIGVEGAVKGSVQRERGRCCRVYGVPSCARVCTAS